VNRFNQHLANVNVSHLCIRRRVAPECRLLFQLKLKFHLLSLKNAHVSLQSETNQGNLGRPIAQSGKTRRLAKGRSIGAKLKKIWQNHGISTTTKIRLLKALVWPVTMYGCECWTLKKTDEYNNTNPENENLTVK
jgi:hypothetical protein